MPLNRRHVSGYLGPGTDPSHANFTWQDNTVSLHLSVVRAASEVASLLTPRRGRAPAGALPVLRRIWLADFRSLTWQPRLHCGLTGDSAGRISPGLRQGAPAARAPENDFAYVDTLRNPKSQIRANHSHKSQITIPPGRGHEKMARDMR